MSDWRSACALPSLAGCKGGWFMNFRILFAVTILTGASIYSVAAAAKVIDQGEIGFTVAHTAQVAATPADVWKMLRMPQSWWSKEHSWSGDAANFWLDSQAGGCFCEKLRSEEHTSELQSLMRISYAVFCLKKKNKTK